MTHKDSDDGFPFLAEPGGSFDGCDAGRDAGVTEIRPCPEGLPPAAVDEVAEPLPKGL